MKTKNVKIKLKDVKAGVVGYVSHPVYGIEKVEFLGRPLRGRGLFVDCKVTVCLGTDAEFSFVDDRSIRDMGIVDSYNGRRTFFKLKHAQAWAKKWATSEKFQADHAEHEAWCDSWYDEGCLDIHEY